MKLQLTLIPLLSVVIFLSHAVFAEGTQTSSVKKDRVEWNIAGKQVESLIDQGKCNEAWNILWPAAKEGSHVARGLLFSFMSLVPIEHALIPPGSSGDWVSQIRHSVIMAIHSSGFTPEEESGMWYTSGVITYYSLLDFPNNFGESFYYCLINDNSKINIERANECIDLAVDTNLVPTFESYAKEIDGFIAQNKAAKCNASNN